MKFKSKINNLKNGFQERKADLANTTFDDFTKFYRKILKRIPDVSHLKNIVLFGALSTLTIFILFAQRLNALNDYLPTRPTYGGVYSEGVQGEIKQLNPLYSPINNAETSVTSLIFSGLTKRAEGGEVKPDLAENWDISTDKKTYTFHLRKGVQWHDGKDFTADDVAFTFQKIQEPDAASAYLASWKGVEVKTLDQDTVEFVLPDPYAYFLDQTNVPIIPRHLLEAIPAASLKSSEFSKAPVGTGPFVFEEFKELKNHQEVWLTANEAYYGEEAYFDQVAIKAYKNYSAVLDAYRYRSVTAIERVNPKDLADRSALPNISAYNLSIPEYDTLIFNLRSGLTKDKALREAVSLALNRQEIIDEVYDGWATPVYSAILPGFPGYTSQPRTAPNSTLASQKLAAAGYTKSAENNLMKDGQLSTLRLVTHDDEVKKKEAGIIAESLKALGFNVEVEVYPFSSFIEDYVRTRNYDLLLISQGLGAGGDLYAYYHGNLRDDPGLNFSGLQMREVDKYLEEARNTQDAGLREARYQSIAKILSQEIPAVNICRPSYIFGVSKDVKGIGPMKLVEPKDKYSQLNSWYVKEVRDY